MSGDARQYELHAGPTRVERISLPNNLVADLWTIAASPPVRSATIDEVGNGRNGYPDGNSLRYAMEHPSDGLPEIAKQLQEKLERLRAVSRNPTVITQTTENTDFLALLAKPDSPLAPAAMNAHLTETERALRAQYPDIMNFCSDTVLAERVLAALGGEQERTRELRMRLAAAYKVDPDTGNLIYAAVYNPFVYNPLVRGSDSFVRPDLRVGLPQLRQNADGYFIYFVVNPDQKRRLMSVAGEVRTQLERGIFPLNS